MHTYVYSLHTSIRIEKYMEIKLLDAKKLEINQEWKKKIPTLKTPFAFYIDTTIVNDENQNTVCSTHKHLLKKIEYVRLKCQCVAWVSSQTKFMCIF